jgi:hypothetical protein
MKKILIGLLLAVICSAAFSQGNPKERIQTTFELGMRYTLIDYIGGPSAAMTFRKDKFSVSIRNDASLSLAKANSSTYFGINKYRVHNYIDIRYNLWKNISPFIGFGWVSTKDEIHRFNNEYGYNTFSIGATAFLNSKILFELRGDIPLVKRNLPVDQNIAFPLSLKVTYILGQKK